MVPHDLVTQVRASIVDENATAYRTLLQTTPPESASDPSWRALLELHARLSDADRQVLYRVMRQVAADTVSNLFGVLDGSTRLRGQSEDLELVTARSRKPLHGSLQDLFLELEETEPQ